VQDVYDLPWSPDGMRIASLSRDRTVRIWDAATGKALQHFQDPALGYIAWSPGGQRILAVSDDKINHDTSLQVWDAITGNGIYTFRVLSKYVQELDWSPNSKLIAAQSGEDGIVQVLHVS
jgi:WD40 repeat protein